MTIGEALQTLMVYLNDNQADERIFKAYDELRNWVTGQIANNMRISNMINGDFDKALYGIDRKYTEPQ